MAGGRGEVLAAGACAWASDDAAAAAAEADRRKALRVGMAGLYEVDARG